MLPQCCFSDVPFQRECPALFTRFPSVQFMDYTKGVLRVLNPERPHNYHLTFSRSERNESDCRRVFEAGGNVAVVFRKPPFPRTFWGYAFRHYAARMSIICATLKTVGATGGY